MRQQGLSKSYHFLQPDTEKSVLNKHCGSLVVVSTVVA